MKKLFVLIAAACMTCTAAFAQTVKPFKEGERAVFLGNSITDGGHYHSHLVILYDPFSGYAYPCFQRWYWWRHGL